jgi:hypothetical protein
MRFLKLWFWGWLFLDPTVGYAWDFIYMAFNFPILDCIAMPLTGGT